MNISKTPPKERHSALAAYRKVLRYIHSNSLQAGDKLAHHSDLVKQLNVCNGTLDIAMKWLIQDGIVSRKQRQGTTLLVPYPENPTRTIWRVGIVLPGLDSSYFFPVLTHYLHGHLERHGASDRTYILSISAMPGSAVESRQPEEFSGLREDIDMGGLHGIVTPTRLHTDELPVCAAAASGHARFGALIDHKHFAAAAAEELYRQGHKKLCVIAGNQRELHTLFSDAVSQIEPRNRAKSPELLHANAGVVSGRNVCDQLLATKASKRPDALIFQDDLTAQGFAARLVHQPDYRPALAVQTNLQIPLAFPVLVTRFELDVNELAASAVELLIEKLLIPDTQDRIVWIAPRLNRNAQEETTTPPLSPPC